MRPVRAGIRRLPEYDGRTRECQPTASNLAIPLRFAILLGLLCLESGA